MHESVHNETMPPWKRLLWIVLFPLVFPAALFGLVVFFVMAGGLMIVMMPQQVWREWKFRRFLRERGRLMEMAKLRPRLQAGQGTLIEEWGTKGVCRIWWTADDLASQETPTDIRERFTAIFTHDENADYDRVRSFNALCLAEYIGRDNGKASLTTILVRHAKYGKLTRDFPRAKRVIVVPPPYWWRANRVV